MTLVQKWEGSGPVIEQQRNTTGRAVRLERSHARRDRRL